ncbi:Inositol phosphorylceramide synthase catalytic subunit AUR1 [Nakaseomyces bracarensis]|uniref:Inositol phosphorylceramide synthase catalytic subunit AUR1 n=1 Tax=Nakaseomyces bracarensis TaxID=273131 RepID=A0ABR4NYV6_9SACH
MSRLVSIRNWFLKDQPANTSATDLEYSFNPMVNVRYLKSQYRFYRANPQQLNYKEVCHYTFMGSVWLFVLVMNPAHLALKLLFYSFLVLLFLTPITSQFFFNALPILTWLALYFTSSYLKADIRPPITVKTLPAIETVLYGDNLSDILATTTHPVLDIFAWIPYGVFHFGAPFVVAAILFLFGPPTILQGYAFAFGYMNLLGVMIQILFPAAPPWYKILYGLDKANYTMKGSPGGLGRIDKLLHIDVYTKGFTNSSVIFGAFPSLHSGCATMEALFFSYCFPFLRPLFIFYVCWLWWSTMYLTHHYFVDLMAGSVLSYVIFQYTKYYHLPVVNTSYLTRWAYPSVSKYDFKTSDPLAADNEMFIENIPLRTYEEEMSVSSRSNSNAISDYEMDMDQVHAVGSNISTPTSIFDRSESLSRSSATSNTSLGNLSNPDLSEPPVSRKQV